MTKRRILLQCHRLSYFYMGLGAIYTKFSPQDVIVDVLFTTRKNNKDSTSYIIDNQNINRLFVYIYENEIEHAYNKLKKRKNNLKDTNYFNSTYKNKILKKVKNIWEDNNYDYCFFCEGNWITDIIYLANPAEKYIMYGDGAGLIYHGSYTKLIHYDKGYDKPYFVPKIVPDEIIALTPYKKDNSVDTKDITISGTNPKTLLEIIEGDLRVQDIVNKFADEIENSYRNCDKKVLLIDPNIENPRFMMSKEEQINLYVDIINKNTTKDSLFIIKPHPSNKKDFSVLSKRCACKIIQFPEDLNILPIEIFSKFLKGIDTVIPFLSSSVISLKLLYDIDGVSIYDIVQNYNLKYRANIDILFYENIIKNLEKWDHKSLIYEENLIPAYKEFYDLYKNKTDNIINSGRNSFLEKIFSVKNITKDGKKYKSITFLNYSFDVAKSK